MTRVCKNTDRFTEAAIDDEIVLMRMDTGEFFSLTGTAVEVWHLIDNERSQSDIVELLQRVFDAPTEVIAQDVSELLSELSGIGLVDQL